MRCTSFVLFIILLLTVVNATMSGVTPAVYEIDFEPNAKHEFRFTFIFGDDLDYEPYISGSFSEYTTIKSKRKAFGRTLVEVELQLPESLDTPGVHTLRVGAKEILTGEDGVSITTDVGGIVKIRVPYPGKYAELDLKAEWKNSGEKVPYELVVNSRGEEFISVKPILEISNTNGITDTINLERNNIQSKQSFKYEGLLPTEGYAPGDYNITAIVQFDEGKEARETRLFRLGELKIEITNHTRKVEKDKVNRFSIHTESFWNDQIDEVYATVDIQGYPDKGFSTPTTYIDPWQKRSLVGFLDTNGIEEDTLLADITLFYAGNKTTTKTVEVEIIKSINWLIIGLIVGAVLIGVILIGLTIAVIKLSRGQKNSKKSKKKSKK